jgi:hypothetical protein
MALWLLTIPSPGPTANFRKINAGVERCLNMREKGIITGGPDISQPLSYWHHMLVQN